MKYRAEIDGLRAVAVVPVILFHAGVDLFRGGFVGVDIFFVISGYLITTILIDELSEEKFSIVTFYERRARRILPALFFVIAICLIPAWFWLLPHEARAFYQSVVSVSLFLSNIFFWLTSNYFDTSAELKPLLHTWSLAVEEQYYIFFPLFLSFFWRTGKKALLAILVLVAILSLVLTKFAATISHATAFYLLPTRGWELMIGAFVAFYFSESRRYQFSRLSKEIGAAIGLVLIAYSVFTFTKETPFPSFYTLAPTCGAALIILFASRETGVGRLLSARILVGVGLISYSAYLWHQPIFAFARHRILGHPALGLMLALSLLALLLGYLTWRFVETPFRDKGKYSRAQIFAYSFGGCVLFLGLGLWGHFSKGFISQSRWDGLRPTLNVLNEQRAGETYCKDNLIVSEFGPVVCLIGAKNVRADGVLWGDSFAGSLWFGMSELLEKEGRAFYFVSSNGCVPIEGASRTVRHEFKCTKERHRAFVTAMLNRSDVKDIVWAGSFATLLGSSAHDYLIDGVRATPAAARLGIEKTASKFLAQGKNLVFVSDVPKFPMHAANYAGKRYLYDGEKVNNGLQSVSRLAIENQYNQRDLLDSLRRKTRVVDALDVFCGNESCSTHDESGKLLFIDEGHLSFDGSRRLAGAVFNELHKGASCKTRS